MEKKLRALIASELERVTLDNAPSVYQMIQSSNGYKSIENMIITMSINEEISISSAIIHLEKSMG